jgi:hypothetical protein
MNASENLRKNALQLRSVLESHDDNTPIFTEAVERLNPLIDKAIGNQKNLPSRLPRFFFGMHEGEFGESHISDYEVMNSLAEFDTALSSFFSK